MKTLFLLFSFFPACAWSHWQGYVGFELGVDHLSGYSQIPRGGNFGTSSFQRPSFAEVNHETDKFYALEFGAAYKNTLVDLKYCHLNPHGSTTLQQPLLTHAKNIPALDNFSMNTNFDLVTLQVGKLFSFQQEAWEISPKIVGQWLKYHYDFNAGSKASRRDFSAFAPGFSLKIEHPLSKRITTAIEGSTSFDLTNLNSYSGLICLHYQLWQTQSVSFVPHVKCGFFEIDFKDNQPFPNHIRYTASPFASLGFIAYVGSN
jgi:hypothetical protein